MNVLSLFDGLSGGRIAIERVGIKVNKYYASEIDKYAQIVSHANYPDIIRLGDVTKWREWDIDFSKIDLLLAGFPCQAWSLAGKQQGDNDPRGALVHTLIEIWNEIKVKNPNMYFLFENVKMKDEFIQYINNLFGVSPVLINSARVSAQNRERLYWTNIPGDGDVDLFGNVAIRQPEDKKIYLKDIIEKDIESKNKLKNVYNLSDETKNNIVIAGNAGLNNFKSTERVLSINGKCNTLTAICGGNQEAKISIDNKTWRKITPLESERLQTLDDNYTSHVSNSQRYKMIGNGWTISVIEHILKGLK